MLALFKRAIQLRYFIINKTHVRVFSNRNMKKKQCDIFDSVQNDKSHSAFL